MTYRNTVILPLSIRAAPVKEPVRVATTGPITIATALNSGDTIDGVTLATGDRVLVWQQSTPSQNGIYVVAASPARAYDMDTADEVPGSLVVVLTGTTYAGSIFQNTNTGTIILDSDSITFALAIADAPNAELNIEGGQSVIKAHGNMGATETFDPTDGNVHTGTLDASCVFTINAPSGIGAATLLFWITGSGTNTWTWPGSVTWLAGTAPDPPGNGETVVVVLTSVDVGVSWLGGPWGSGGGGDPSTDTQVWMPLTSVDGGEPVLVWDGDDSLIPDLVPV